MRALRSLMTARRRLFLALFACALLLRLAIPAGWMPVAQADGGVRLAICPGVAPVASRPMTHAMHGDAHRPMTQATHGDTTHQPMHDHGDHAPPCAFTGLALAAALPDSVPAPRVPPIAASPTAPIRAFVSVGRGLAAPPPPQTGPPFLA